MYSHISSKQKNNNFNLMIIINLLNLGLKSESWHTNLLIQIGSCRIALVIANTKSGDGELSGRLDN